MKERGTQHPCTPEQWKFPGGTFLVIEIMDDGAGAGVGVGTDI